MSLKSLDDWNEQVVLAAVAPMHVAVLLLHPPEQPNHLEKRLVCMIWGNSHVMLKSLHFDMCTKPFDFSCLRSFGFHCRSCIFHLFRQKTPEILQETQTWKLWWFKILLKWSHHFLHLQTMKRHQCTSLRARLSSAKRSAPGRRMFRSLLFTYLFKLVVTLSEQFATASSKFVLSRILKDI